MKKKKEDNQALEVFQGRTPERVNVKPAQWISKIEWKKDGSVVWVTNEKSAKGRTYRFHEAQHLNHTPVYGRRGLKALNPWAKMGIEDVILHTRYIPDNLPISVLRDEKATALQDLRMAYWTINYISEMAAANEISLEQLAKHDDTTAQFYNYACVIGLRARAILSRYRKARKSKLPDHIENIYKKVLRRTKWGMLHKAGKMFEKILLPSGNDLCSSMTGRAGTLPVEGEGDETTLTVPGWFSPPVGSIRPEKPFIRTPDTDRPGHSNPMPIIELPMDVKTESVSHNRAYRFQSSGSQPAPHRLARASFSPLTNLFKVKMRHEEPGGTFLLDGSGSMGIRSEKLALILEKIPSATIAYYSGDVNEENNGLKIYAQNGYRSSIRQLPNGGSNDWDHQALQWLLTKKPPLFFITDEQFASDYNLDPGQITKAKTLLKKNRSKLHMYSSYDGLLEALINGDIERIMKK